MEANIFLLQKYFRERNSLIPLLRILKNTAELYINYKKWEKFVLDNNLPFEFKYDKESERTLWIELMCFNINELDISFGSSLTHLKEESSKKVGFQ